MAGQLREARSRGAGTAFERLAAGVGSLETRAIGSTDGSGGTFIPPMWMLNYWYTIARTGASLGSAVHTAPTPRGTNQITLPGFAPAGSGSAGVEPQGSDNTTVNQVDPTTSKLTLPVVTMAGQYQVSQQLFDQAVDLGGGIAFDEIVTADLVADYIAKREAALWNGTGNSGQILGVLNTPGITSVSYTAGTPTAAGLLTSLGQAFGQFTDARLRPPGRLYMAGRRFAWLASSQATSSGDPFEVIGGAPADADLEANDGPFGPVLGLPVYCNGALPTNLGTGDNQDVLVLARPSDYLMFEGVPDASVMVGDNDAPKVGVAAMNNQQLAGQLTVIITFHTYLAFTAARYPSATAVLTGTGLVGPSGF